MKGPSQESLHVIVVYFVVVVLLLMPRVADAVIPAGGHRKIVAGGGGSKRSTASKSYAVIFDAGSSGSRVHVYCFDENLDLVPIGDDIELFVQTKPGLSSYANDPQAAADSLIPLLEEAESLVPAELRSKTPVKLGATAGLRALGTETSDQILQVVKDLLEEKSSLKYKPEWVTVIDGTEEGAFEWVTVNYLLGNLGKESSNTVGAVDLGGGSVQMAYAISEKDAANAPRNSDGEDTYVKELFVRGTKYYLYVHSYLNYGLLAARAEILKAGNESYSYCILDGYQGSYTYSGVEYEVSASPSGSSFTKCRSDVVTALKIDEPCTYMNCTFNGVWNGGVGDGLKNVYLASFFHSRANEVGLVNPSAPNGKATPAAFEEAAKSVCKLNMADAKTAYPLVKEEDLPYLCMDLVYQYTLLVDGFGLEPRQEITLVAQMEYGDYLVEVAWPLGSALELISSDDALQVRGPLYLS